MLIFLLFLCSCAPVIVPATVTPTVAVQATTTPRPTVTPTATPNAVEVEAQSLHVRREPMGLRIDYVYRGTVVTITDCQDGWAQIDWHGSVAYVRAKYLSDNKCQTK
jgi:hypothetical protein